MLMYWKNKVSQLVESDVGKRVLSTILAVVMVFGLLPTYYAPEAGAANTTTSTGTRQTLNGGSWTLPAGSFTNVCYTISGNTTVTVESGKTVTINNQANGGSPFTLNSGATLNLVVNGRLNVYGQSAESSPAINESNISISSGGAGGYAGISVPTGTTLNVSGSGSLYAYGGDAGDSGDAKTNASDQGTGGGGGAGAGIGGNGGAGGDSNTSAGPNEYAYGHNGISAGTVNITGASTKVYAYGGGGGSSGVAGMGGGGTGGGGYPAAGIGGGGAGGGGEQGGGGAGGGFSAGTGETTGRATTPGTNGSRPVAGGYYGGGSYFQGASTNTLLGDSGPGYGSGYIGGGWSIYRPEYPGRGAGGGGTAGAGGTVTYVNRANVNAYNGNYVTTAASGASGNNWGANQTGIYAQLGYDLTKMRGTVTQASWNASNKTYTFTGTTPSNTAIGKTRYGLGIGSGAGFTESSNGTVRTTPAAPTLNSAARSASQEVQLKWTAPSDNGGSNVTGYKVYVYSDSACNTQVKAQDVGNVTQYNVNGLTNGTTYYFKVVAKNALGEGTLSTSRSAKPYTTPNTPSAPTVAGTKASGELKVTWTAPGNGGDTISGYTVKLFSDSSCSNQIKTQDVNGTTLTYTFTDLTNGARYYAKVTAKNAAGPSADSNAGNGYPYTLPTKPGAPTVTVTDENAKVVVNWTTPANGGAALSKIEILDGDTVLFTITSTQNAGYWSKATTAGEKPSVTLTGTNGIKSGVTQNIKIRVTNAAGSVTSDGISIVSAGVPSAPTNVKAVATEEDGELRVTWTVPATNKSTITGYVFMANNKEVGRLTKASLDQIDKTLWTSMHYGESGQTATRILTGLTNGTRYPITVYALSSAGSGAESTVTTDSTATPYYEPAAPTGVKVDRGVKSVTVRWDAAANHGNDIIKYHVYEVDSQGGYHLVGSTTDGNTRSMTLSQDYQGTAMGNGNREYTYVVSAENAAREGPKSAPDSNRSFGLPNQVSTPTVTTAGEKSVSVTWDALLSDEETGGTEITQYIINWTKTANGNNGVNAQSGSKPFATEDLVLTDGKYTVSVDTLERGATYRFTVTAENAAGRGPASNGRDSRTLDQPGRVTASAARTPSGMTKPDGSAIPKTGSVTVTWGTPADGEGITGYTIYVYTYDDATRQYTLYDTVRMAIGALTPDGSGRYAKEISGLRNGTTYYFEVTASNDIGESLPSSKAGSVPQALPGQPENIKASRAEADGITDQTSLRVTWDAADANGSPITKYTVEVWDAQNQTMLKSSDTGTDIVFRDLNNGSCRDATIRNLEPGTSYDIHVYATNGWGADTGDRGLGVGRCQATTASPPVGDTIELSAVGTGAIGQLAISWGYPKQDGGRDITNYQILIYSDENTGDNTEEAINKIAEEANQSLDIQSDDGYVHANAAEKDTIRLITVTNAALRNWTISKEHTMGPLADGHKYKVRIRARNTFGWGPWSSAEEASAYGAPLQTKDVSGKIAIGGASLNVTWADPADSGGVPGNGGQELTEYQLELEVRDEMAESGWAKVTNFDASVTGEILHSSNGVLRTVHVVHAAEILNLTAGKTYRVNVKAWNAGNLCSSYDAYTDEITMWTTPGEAQSLMVTPTNSDGGLRVTWRGADSGNPVMNTDPDNVAHISAYKIYYRLQGSDSDPACVTYPITEETENAASYTRDVDTADGTENGPKLTNGETYEVWVTAVNNVGETSKPAEGFKKVTGIPRRPADAPTISEEITSGNSSAVLSWLQAPINDESGSEIQSYVIFATELDQNGNAVGLPEAKRTVTAAPDEDQRLHDITIPDLVNGTRYAITASAVNGTNTPGAESNVTHVLVGIPEAPVAVEVQPTTGLRAEVTVTPGSDNGNTIEYYVVYINGEPYRENKQIKQFPAKEPIFISADGGVPKDIQVAAGNRVALSDKSMPAVTVTFGAPTTPTLSEPVIGTDGVTLTWTPSQGNGITMLGYTVYLQSYDEATKTWSKFAPIQVKSAPNGEMVTTGDGEKSYKLTYSKDGDSQLKAGVQYQVMVKARNFLGESPDSLVKSFQFGVPAAPEVTKVVSGEGSLTVSFTPPTETGLDNAALTAFTVYANRTPKLKCWINAPTGHEGDAQWDENGVLHVVIGADGTDKIVRPEGSGYTVTLDGLANGAVYTIQATAWNVYGESPKSQATSNTNGTPSTTPGAPRALTAAANSNTEISLSWKAPLNNGGAKVQSYTIQVLDEDGGEVRNLSGIKNTEYKVGGLSDGTRYTFRVYAENEKGTGKEADSVTATTYNKPDAPTIVNCQTYKDGTSYTLEIQWSAPTNNGGTAITGYKVWLGNTLKSGTAPLSPVLGENENYFSYKITGLRHMGSYTVRVAAVNQVCESNGYASLNCATRSIVAGKLSAPTLTARPGVDDTGAEDGSIVLSWNAVEDAGYYAYYDLGAYMRNNNATVDAALDYYDKNPYVDAISFAQGSEEFNARRVRLSAEELEGGAQYYAIRALTTQNQPGYISEICEITLGGPTAIDFEAEGCCEHIEMNFTPLKNNDSALKGNKLVGYQVLVDSKVYTGNVLLSGSTLLKNTDHVITDPKLLTSETPVTLQLDIKDPSTYKVTLRAVTEGKIEDTDQTVTLPGQAADEQEAVVWARPTTPVVNSADSGNESFTVRFRPAEARGKDIEGYAVFYENKNGDLEVLEDSHTAADTLETDSNGYLSLTVTGVKNGYKDEASGEGYKYYVAAYVVTEDGSRYYSPEPDAKEIRTIVTGVPSAPEITGTFAGDGSIRITYTKPPMSDDLAVSNYVITWVVGDGEPQSTTEPIQDNYYTISGLNNGTTYTISVRAVNISGESLESEPVTATPGTPPAPEILDYAASDSEISVRWRAPSITTGISPVQSYRVYYTDTRDGSQYVKNVDGSQTSVVLSGKTPEGEEEPETEPDNIENGVSYTITVVAVNDQGEGDKSQSLTLMPGTNPEAPVPTAQVTGASTASGTVTVSWPEPNDGGLAIDYYRVTGIQGTDAAYIVDANDANNYTTGEDGQKVYRLVLDELSANTTYQFKVEAHNKRDFGKAGETKAVKTSTVPDPPQWKGISSVNYTFTAMWQAPVNTGSNDGSTEILGYNVYLNNSETPINTAPLTIGDDEEEGLTIDEKGVISYTAPTELPSGDRLVMGETYEVSVAAVNAVGASVQTSTMYIMIQGQAAETVPGKPRNVHAVAGNGQMTVSWTAPNIEGVVEGIEGYYVCYRPQGTATYTEVWHSGNQLERVITGLDNNTTYDVCVKARNRKGTGSESGVVTVTPVVIEAPTTPKNIAYWNNSTMNRMTVTWDAVVPEHPELTGDVEYHVYINNTGEKADYVTKSTEVPNIPVESNITYKIWVVAKHTGGSSERDIENPHILAQNWLNVDPTNSGNPTVNLDREGNGELDDDQLATKPTAPTVTSAVVQDGKILVSWTVPVREYNDGTTTEFTDIEYYKIYVNGVETYRTDDGTKLSYPYEPTKTLATGDIYSFQVSAVNSEGEGENSAPFQLFVQGAAEDAPKNLTYEMDSTNPYTTVKLTWDAASGEPDHYLIQVNGGNDYELEVAHEPNEDGKITCSYAKLKPNNNYVIRVLAVKGGEESKTTKEVIVSTQIPVPNAPSGLTAEKAGSNIKLAWTAPETGEYTGYYLYVDGVRSSSAVLTREQKEYVFTPVNDKEYSFALTAVNDPTGEDNYARESAKSNTATASIREIQAGAPAAPENFTLQSVDPTNKNVTLRWSAVDAPEGTTIKYYVYVSKDGGELTEVAVENPTDNGDGTLSYVYQEPAQSTGDIPSYAYEFHVRAAAVTQSGEELLGAMSAATVTTSTKPTVDLPATPTGLEAVPVKDDSGNVTSIVLSWRQVSNAERYYIYCDATKLSDEVVVSELPDKSRPSYTYTLTAEDRKKDSFIFQVAAVNNSDQQNSVGMDPGISELSDNCVVNLDGGISAGDLPAAAGAPKIEMSVHNAKANVIRVYWSAPTVDVEGGELPIESISGYQINLNKVDGTSTSYTPADHVTSLDSKTGWYYYDIAVDKVEMGEQYAVTVTAWRSFTVSGNVYEVPGASQTPWIIMQNLNLDEDGDFVVDKYPDPDGDGIENVEAGTLVKLTVTLNAGGAASVAPTLTVTDQAGTNIEVLKWEPEAEGSSKWVAEYRVMTGLTYDIKITKPGCTYFELKGVPMDGVSSIDLNEKNGGNAVDLLAGELSGDGRINVTDLNQLLEMYGARDSTDISDLNGDGRVNITDLNSLLENYGGRSTTISWSDN